MWSDVMPRHEKNHAKFGVHSTFFLYLTQVNFNSLFFPHINNFSRNALRKCIDFSSCFPSTFICCCCSYCRRCRRQHHHCCCYSSVFRYAFDSIVHREMAKSLKPIYQFMSSIASFTALFCCCLRRRHLLVLLYSQTPHSIVTMRESPMRTKLLVNRCIPNFNRWIVVPVVSDKNSILHWHKMKQDFWFIFMFLNHLPMHNNNKSKDFFSTFFVVLLFHRRPKK